MEQQIKSISVSVVNSSKFKESTDPKHWKVYINLPRALSEKLNLETNRNAIIKYENGKVRMAFTKNREANTQLVSITKSSARVPVSQSIFGTDFAEHIRAKRLNAVISNEEVVFEFDPEVIEADGPYVPETRKITNNEDKAKAGFKTESSWGVRLHATADEAITNQYLDLLKARLK